MIKTKSIYDPPLASDGIRALVMRLWPRGVKKEKIGGWFKELGPSAALIKKWKSGKITWTGFKKEYLDEYKDGVKKTALAELKGLIKTSKGTDVTLLCSCRDEDRCHRRLVRELLKRS